MEGFDKVWNLRSLPESGRVSTQSVNSPSKSEMNPTWSLKCKLLQGIMGVQDVAGKSRVQMSGSGLGLGFELRLSWVKSLRFQLRV